MTMQPGNPSDQSPTPADQSSVNSSRPGQDQPITDHRSPITANCPKCGTALEIPNPQSTIRNPQWKDPDEINLLEYIYVLVKNKWWIIGVTIAGLAIGYVAALIKGPTWVATAVIAPKEAEGQKGPSLAGFGALGGIVASQLDLGSASLEKMEVVLQSRKFTAEMVNEHGLMPLILKHESPDLYAKGWDESVQKWRDGFTIPDPRKASRVLTKEYLEVEADKKGTLRLKLASPDSLFSARITAAYVDHLNTYLKETVEDQAKKNVTYLEGKVSGVTDVLLREKIQGLIAKEIEKAMVVSWAAFDIIDPVFVGQRFTERILYPLFVAFGFLFASAFTVILGHAVSSASRTQETGALVRRIRNELTAFPSPRRRK